MSFIDWPLRREANNGFHHRPQYLSEPSDRNGLYVPTPVFRLGMLTKHTLAGSAFSILSHVADKRMEFGIKLASGLFPVEFTGSDIVQFFFGLTVNL